MFKLAVVGTVAAVATANNHPVTQDVVDAIRAKATTWEPMEVHENPLSKLSTEQVFGLLGAKVAFGDAAPNGKYITPTINPNIPANFDSREQWPGAVHAIRDQGACGSCWAFAATEALSDRFAIASHGKVDVVLSPEYMISCDGGNMGCQGGYLNKAWDFLEESGSTDDACYEYKAVEGECPSTTCPSDGAKVHIYKCQPNSTIEATNAKQIQSAILEGGPMETGFQVYKDFFAYKSGVYKKTSPFWDYQGGHAVKIIGWGNDGKTNYWIAANSWGTAWGDNGFFKVAFGEVGFDSDVFACTPAHEHHTTFLA